MIDVSRIGLIARREWLTRIKQRSFRLTTIFQVLVILVGAALPAILSATSGDDPEQQARLIVIDMAGVNAVERIAPFLAEPVVDVSMQGLSDSTVSVEPASISVEEARQQVDDGDADSALIVQRGADGRLAFTYISDDTADATVTQRVFAAASNLSTEDRLAAAGVSQAAFDDAVSVPAFSLVDPQGEETHQDGGISGARYAIALVFTVLTFMAIMLYGTWVAQGVVEEKSSRIMEIMINAATPNVLLAGKIIGIGLAGLTQLAPMLLIGGLVFGLQEHLTRWLGGDASSLPDLEFSTLSFRAVGFFLVYFLLGFSLYATMYAGLGSLVSRQEEVNTAVSPMMTLMFAGYFGAILSIGAPESMVSRVLSIVPFSAPFVMMPRIIVSDVPAWEIILSLVLLAMSVVLFVWLAARLYRMGVLMYGQRPSLRSLFRSGAIRTAR